MNIFKSALLAILSMATLMGCLDAGASDLSETETAMLFAMLSSTPEVRIHQMGGAIKNSVYVHKDGHKEAVYDGEGKLVQDGINDGSYNFAHPVNAPFEHFEKDIHPWILFGASPSDPTKQSERIFAYVQDLEFGLTDARRLWPENTDDYIARLSKAGEVPPIWAEVMKDPEARSVFDIISGEGELKDEALIEALKAVHDALQQAY